jgi:hypothetical protein
MKRYAYTLALIVSFLAVLAGTRSGSTPVLSKTGRQTQEPVSLSLDVARRGHTATTLTDGRVIIIGGQNQTGLVYEAEVIDTAKETVTVVATLRVARFHHTATRLSDGSVFIIGGSDSKGPLKSTEIFDPQTYQFRSGPRLNLARAGHSATRLKDGRLLIAGGRADGSAEIFDEITGEFTQIKLKMNGLRNSHGAVLLKNGTVLIAGGIGPDGQALDTAELFKPNTESFYPISTWMYSARVRPDMRVLPDGKVQIIGGDGKGTMEMYDPSGRYFRGSAELASAADSLPASSLLRAQTRAAFIDRAKGDDTQNLEQPAEAASIQKAEPASDNSLFRADYASAEVPQLNLAVIAGGVDEKDQVVRSVTLIKSVTAFVTTDKVEYPPAGAPVIRGGGWQSNEIIVIHRLEVKTGQFTIFKTVADNDGKLAYDGLSTADHQTSNYALTAVGQFSGYVAQTIYRRAPALDPEKAGKPPQRVKFNIPVSGNGEGIVQTYSGPYKYKITYRKQGTAGGNIQPAARLDFGTLDKSWSGVGVSFPAPLPPLGWTTSGRVHLDGYIEVTADIDFGLPPNPVCCACEVACELIDCEPGACSDVCDGAPCSGRLPDLKVTAKFVANFDVSITNNFHLEGTVVNQNNIPVLPLLVYDVPPGPGAPFGFNLTVGLLGGIKLSFEKAMEFETCLSFGANTTTTISVGLTSGTSSSFSISNEHASSGFEMIKLGSTCIQLSLGPGIAGKIYSPECSSLIELDARPVAGFIEGCFGANEVDPNCKLYNINIDGGLKADFRIPIGCGAISVPLVNLEHEYFRRNIASFDLGVFKDSTPPVISVPSDFTQSADLGSCSAIVNYDASANDYCSGVKSFSCIPPTGSVFPTGTTTVSCTAVDNAGRQFACTNPAFNGNISTRTFKVTIVDTELPKFTSQCPGNIAKNTDPGRCSAVTTFTPPTASDNCPGVAVTCVPPPGFAFPKGVTTVTCTAADAANNKSSCSFTITVNDTEAPSITCPSNVTAVTPVQGAPTAAVTYAAPTGSDNCPGVTFACVPPSGSTFSVGTTNVTCTATDASGNHTSCQFTVTLFNVCLQDDSNPNNVLLFKTSGAEKGQYRFCCNGTSYTGVGTIMQQGNTYSLTHNVIDRRVQGTINSDGSGWASMQFPAGRTICTITDRASVGVHTCVCGPGATQTTAQEK